MHRIKIKRANISDVLHFTTKVGVVRVGRELLDVMFETTESAGNMTMVATRVVLRPHDVVGTGKRKGLLVREAERAGESLADLVARLEGRDGEVG